MNDPTGIGAFIVGLFLIPFSLVVLWKNERKLVMYTRVVEQGRQAVRTVDCEKPDDANDFELVHVVGDTLNKQELSDADFAIIAKNSYRLKRKVEMYQWREKSENDDGHTRYTYD